MSGGYFDYKQFQLLHVADELGNLLDEHESLESVQDKEALIKEFDNLIKMLDYSYKVIHHIDYFLSDDISEETMWKRIENVKKESEL